MTDTATAVAESATSKAAKGKEEGSFLAFLLKLALGVFILRSFIFSPFSIPSESMLPGLWNGDQLVAQKWAYGYSRYSLPFSLPLILGRIFAHQPERGDVVIFKHPVDKTDYIKRVIGLPGDQIQVIEGQVFINGTPVKKERVDDFIIPVSPNTHCKLPIFEANEPDGSEVCRYPQFRETLPEGKSYNVLDFGLTPQDNTSVVTVPEGRLFVMGDNRDNSMDSRFPAIPGQGVGLVPQEDLVARASFMMWSSDGSAEWYNPLTWFTTVRWNRIGGSI